MRFLIGTAELKVPGGKLVRARVDYGISINEVKLTGDFFLHPEESLAEIEESLCGIDRDLSHEKIAERVKEIVNSHGITLIGLTEDAIAKVVREAIK